MSRGILIPYTPWNGEGHFDRHLDYLSTYTSVSLVHFPIASRPGNSLVSITVLQNTLRNHFQNEIYFLGAKRYIHIHLLFKRSKYGEILFLDQVFPGKKTISRNISESFMNGLLFLGETCLAVATITSNKRIVPQPVVPGGKDPFLIRKYNIFD